MAGVSALMAGAVCVALAPGALAAGTPSLATLSSHGGAQRIANTTATGKAKNVILFIGDGMGDSEITVARDYLYDPGGTLEGIDKIGQADATSAKTLGLASSTEEINALSSGAKVSVKDGVAQVTGFNGDAVLGYQLQDTETGTPVSGVRVDTGATTTIDFNGIKGFDPSASTYTLTATGKQSGTKIATEFGLTGNGASNVVIAPKTGDKAADNAKQAGLGGALVGCPRYDRYPHPRYGHGRPRPRPCGGGRPACRMVPWTVRPEVSSLAVSVVAPPKGSGECRDN